MRDEHILQLDPDEHVLYDVKRSLFGVAHYLFAGFIGLLLLLAALFYVGKYHGTSSLSISPGWAVLISVAVFMVVELAVYIMISTYFNNKLTVTDQSIVQRLQFTPLNFKTSQLGLGNIEDVTYASNGLLPSLFSFGTINIETAGEQVNFIFTFSKDPREAVRVIIEAKENFLQGQASSNFSSNTSSSTDANNPA